LWTKRFFKFGTEIENMFLLLIKKHIMKTAQKIKLSILATIFVSAGAYAQDTRTDAHKVEIRIPEVAILDLESVNKSLSFGLTANAPTEAGLPLNFEKVGNSDLWLNYSSIIGSKSDPSRDVTVQIIEGSIPSSIELVVSAGKDTGGGEGRMGEPAGEIVVDGSAQKIITGVGSAYTGNGVKNGHNLTYTLRAKRGAYAELDFDTSNAVMITYTLSDN
jgi:hypothetical protein